MSRSNSTYSLDEYESSGPRPPVPGEEEFKKMTESSSDYGKSYPSYLKWAEKLINLLDDREGVALFTEFTNNEGGIHADLVKFYFASEGFKHQPDPAIRKNMISAIYRFLRKSQLQTPEDIRRQIKNCIKNDISVDPNIFNEMQENVMRMISETSYINFLQSDIYLNYVQKMQGKDAGGLYSGAEGSNSGGSSSSENGAGNEMISRSATLPTLHEDSELLLSDSSSRRHIGGSSRTPSTSGPATSIPRLTKELILATQIRRLEMRPPGAHGYSAYPSCASYNPVSRVDSERQSCSSGGGYTDTESIKDGRSYTRRKTHIPYMNRETEPDMVIPRTQRKDNIRDCSQLKPNDLIQILFPKLEEVKREKEAKEKVAKSLLADSGPTTDQNVQNKLLADAIRAKLMLEDDNDQSILDQHVSRVWSDLTPHRSPGTHSPHHIVMKRSDVLRNAESGIELDRSIGGSSTMRHSKSMPDGGSSKGAIHKWPSMNTDSGISMYSSDTVPRDFSRSRASMSTSSQLDESKRRTEDTRRSRRSIQPTPSCTGTLLHGSHAVSDVPSTVVLCSFSDESMPYRMKINGQGITLKQLKDNLPPKKGNLRFFFKTTCDDPENPIIQEEITNDSEVLPMFEGSIIVAIKCISSAT